VLSIEYQENEKIIPHYSITSRSHLPVFCGLLDLFFRETDNPLDE
jgi:hypothetical protein